MRHTLAIAWVIARRDYVAAVFSRLFVIFLALPLTLFAITALFGAIGSHSDDGPAPAPHVRLDSDAATVKALQAARARIAARLGEDVVPVLTTGGDGGEGVLAGGLDRPRLRLRPGAPDALPGQIDMIVAQARAGPAADAASVSVIRDPHGATPPASADKGRTTLARGAQYAILVLTMMLAGRLLSSFVEERGNKVIEILAAAVPIDAIFLGKLAGMLLFSLTCVAAWGGVGLAAVLIWAPGTLAAAPVPAVGWPAFVVLALLYFTASYTLLGAIMLGLGSQATSPADIQTLALPTTMAQLLLFGLASIDVARPEHWVAQVAAIFPWSSPLAMIARAAERAPLWPHLLGLAWQALWLVVAVRFASARFRRGVLKSGPARRRRATSSG